MWCNNALFVDFRRRVALAEQAEADIFVSIHVNAHNSNAQGYETLYSKGSRLGKILAQDIHNSIITHKLYTNE